MDPANTKQTKTQFNVEELSDDILLEIFHFLDKSTLKRSSNVCQR